MFARILRFNRVTSTQDIARRLVLNHQEAVIAARAQSQGRGRQRRRWFSPRGGLYVSFLLFPRCRQHALPLAAARAVIHTLEQCGFSNLSIHWPNDILLDRRKVCGILCEQVRGAVICGIGLNINTARFPRALGSSTGNKYDLDRILEILVKAFDHAYRALQNGDLAIQDLRPYLSGLGEPIQLRTREKRIAGTIFDIDDDWALLLAEPSGRIRKYVCGDVLRMKW